MLRKQIVAKSKEGIDYLKFKEDVAATTCCRNKCVELDFLMISIKSLKRNQSTEGMKVLIMANNNNNKTVKQA